MTEYLTLKEVLKTFLSPAHFKLLKLWNDKMFAQTILQDELLATFVRRIRRVLLAYNWVLV